MTKEIFEVFQVIKKQTKKKINYKKSYRIYLKQYRERGCDDCSTQILYFWNCMDATTNPNSTRLDYKNPAF